MRGAGDVIIAIAVSRSHGRASASVKHAHSLGLDIGKPAEDTKQQKHNLSHSIVGCQPCSLSASVPHADTLTHLLLLQLK